LLVIWRRSCVLFMFYFIPMIAAIIGVLISERTSICNKPLKEWLLILGLLYFWMSAFNLCIYMGLPKLEDPSDQQERRIKVVFKFYVICRILDFVWFVWFLLGIIWTATADCYESAPNTLMLCIALIFIHISLFCCATFFCCCTCFGLLYQIGLVAEDRAPGGATKKMIKKLKSKAFQSDDVKKDDAGCAICLGEYEEHEIIRYLPCSHHFHGECIDQWLRINKSCPLCKHLIDQEMSSVKSPHPNVPLQEV